MSNWRWMTGLAWVGLAWVGLAAWGCTEEREHVPPVHSGSSGTAGDAAAGATFAGSSPVQGEAGAGTPGAAGAAGLGASPGGGHGGAAAGAGGAGGEAPVGSERITFEDLELPAESYWNGSDGSAEFQSGFGVFANQYDATYGSWSGFSYSNTTDVETPDFSNQYSAAPGSGAEGSATYAVGYRGFEGRPRITFPNADSGIVISGAYVANTTYAAAALRDGSDFSKRFGGADGTDPDWFLLEIFGVTRGGELTGPVEFFLADYRSPDPALDGVEAGWRWVELSGLGPVVELEFELSSSDMGSFGMNTPAYFALDDLTRE